ncbi:unnamed protein product [Dovyalis caffra]|uniref:PGG domain-containing protein n=1 Tax=Dovyalis caffra TaxID=77055 RepID=A0AAV1R2C2_9ROSI|nr:unnamed protein product [Dovyalis caffra]
MTPMHLGAYLDYPSAVKPLLNHDQSVAYFRNRDGMTALYIAASVGAISSIKKLMGFCPDCAKRLIIEAGMRFTSQPKVGKAECELINEGNTPLNVLATSSKYILALINRREVDKWSLNDNDLTPLEMVPNSTLNSTCAEADIHRSLNDKMHLPDNSQNLPYTTKENPNGEEKTNGEGASILQRIREIHLTLIATVTFAADFTLSDGHNSEGKDKRNDSSNRKKLLLENLLLQKTIAMILAISAVFLHFISAMHNEVEIHDFLDSSK